MAAGTSACLCMTLLSVVLSVSAGETNIRPEPGQTVSLPCKALNNDPVIVVQWRRTDLKEKYVLLYRDDQSDPARQHPSYKNRVDLQDRQMKDGDVSLILNNVTIEDSGIYECSVVQNKINQKRSTIRLEVVPPDGHKEDEGVRNRGHKDTPVGLIVGLIVGGVLVVGVVGFLIYRRYRQRYRPPPEQSADPQQL